MLKDLLDVKGSWRQRMFIYVITFFLTILCIWVLDFVTDDIRSLEKPEWSEVEKTYLSQPLVDKRKLLQQQIDDKNALIAQLNAQRTQLKESTQSTQVSLKQLDEQQKILLQHNQSLSADETQFKNTNLALFQKNQVQDQALAQSIINLTMQAQQLTTEVKAIDVTLDKERKPATEAYNKALKKELLIEAALQICFLLVVITLAGYLLYQFRKSMYKLPLLAFFLAACYEIVIVLHECFPTVYFKYILIVVLIAIMAKILIYLVKNAGSSKPEILLKRYRDAYTYFICPTCEFPIRRGPMKFLYWTRRSVAKMVARMSISAGMTEHPMEEEVYICPVCSTNLFTSCKKCKGTRYSLLPACQHCGEESENITHNK